VNLFVSLLIVVASTAASIVALLLVRRWAPHGGHFGDTNRAVGVFALLATSFAVLFAFVVFFAFGSYDRSSASAEVEAQVAMQQFETAQLLPEAYSPLLGAQLRCYALSVVHQEWPAMARGETLGLNEWDTDLFVTLEGLETADSEEDAAYAKWLDQRSDREEARQERALGEDGVIPAPLWFVLLISGGIVWAFVFLFADSGEGTFVQSILIGTVTATLVAGMLLVVFLDKPYNPGAGSLKPTAMEQTIEQMDELTGRLSLDLPEVCDAEGNRL
jgi:hypothetical protein